MDIVYYVPGLPCNRETLGKQALGGSETAGLYKARELARRGHRVRVFTSHPESETAMVDNLQFIYHGNPTQAAPMGDRFEHYARNTPHDVLIIQRAAYAFHQPFAAKVCVHEHHDLALHRSASQILAGAWQVGAFTAVSEWHKAQMCEVYGLNPDTVHVVPNGVDHALYVQAERLEDPFIEEGELDAGVSRLIYQSRPERGLEHLVRPGGIMDRVRDLPIKLYIFGYENTTAQMAPFYDQLKGWAEALPNVKWVGAVDKLKLARYQTFADLLIYPTEFEEVSCITAMEAMHAGLPMLSSKVGALPETCERAGAKLYALVDGKANEDKFVEKLKDWFEVGASVSERDAFDTMRKYQETAAESKTWEASTDALESAIGGLFQATTAAIVRTAIERSDIRFAQQVLAAVGPTDDPIVENSRVEIAKMYAFLDSDEAYAAHYAKHQGEYYDKYDMVGEDVTSTTRFRGVALLVQNRVRDSETPLRILDYGCAHGHYSMPLARSMPKHSFVGRDISERAVESYNRWAARDGTYNAVATVGTTLEDGEMYDVIIAGEVLEHVREPYALLEHFRAHMNPGALLVLTTPLGRWEHSGVVAFRSGREHVEHFERADLDEIFEGHRTEILQAPASVDKSGFPLGSWVTGVKFTEGMPIGRPSFDRKLATYRPRETISACLIVKDGEQTLRGALESIVDWVDQIVVTVDAATTDRTMGVLADFAADFPLCLIRFSKSVHSAVKDGFDTLRNESIEQARGDWILWFDADEIVRRPFGLHKLARPSMHNGYGFKQVHYSADPAQVLNTDMPCRFFRNRRGVKFYGVVHEHPETEPGKGVPFSIVRPEVEFLHSGYVDEETRRSRYYRNFPLVLRDFEKYPERKINWFLMIRDLAQGIVFERQQMRGGLAQHHLDNAQKGVDLFVKMTKNRGGHIGNRMLVDCLPYYSACVETLGIGFVADFKMGITLDAAPDMSASAESAARFHNPAFFVEFITSIIQEATAKHGSKYI